VSHIRLETSDRVATITLDRPDRMNAFAGEMRKELAEAVEDAMHDDQVRALVITGAGRAFSAGADLQAMAELVERGDEHTFEGFMRAGMRTVKTIRRGEKPVIAALNGPAAGAGASLALACDIRLAAPDASIGITFVRIGLHPDWGASHHLVELVGRGRAAELMYTGRMVPAEEAARMGLVDRVVEGDFGQEVADYARRLAAGAPRALTEAKHTLGAADLRALDAALDRESDAQMRLFRSGDLREGIAAFIEKRDPNFTGA
jgi:2-(1,2-epoxy-1,2-dihydrophenyl)acetyl-CoA isomerase